MDGGIIPVISYYRGEPGALATRGRQGSKTALRVANAPRLARNLQGRGPRWALLSNDQVLPHEVAARPARGEKA